ncbi:hypothetical protein B0H19DRAFT_304415 [Mycena capillaripes]|nr:hypothetical protein B0H19DRAFT_304415 [Mycena capillaripes]
MFSITMKLKSIYAHITLNWVTIAFFLFSMVHCFAQGVIQSFLFSLDSEFAGLVTKIVHAADIPQINMTYLDNDYVLRMCNNIPHGQQESPCTVLYERGHAVVNDSTLNSDFLESSAILRDLNQGFSISPNRDSAGNVSGVTIQSNTAQSVFLSHLCTQILVYPQEILQNSVREDITSIFMQFWLMGVSVFAVSHSSVPHMLTALGTRFLVTSWSGYIAAYRTNNQATTFHEMISAPGTACGVELFPTYFGTRQVYNIADLVLSCTALLLSGLLTWNLLKVYNAQSFQRVGAPEQVLRIYKYFMAVQACLQLGVFVIVAATSLWVAVLTQTAIREISAHTAIYNALIIATTVLVIPWLALGWYGVRREERNLVIAFLAVAFFFVSGWAIMFYSIVYRWSFLQWPYLGCFTVASFILIISSAILATICWRNFDKGLAQYLNAEAALASLNFAPEVFKHSDVEKSGHYYEYDEPEFPKATFQSADSASKPPFDDGFRMPAPLRGPPPAYNKPYNAPEKPARF